MVLIFKFNLFSFSTLNALNSHKLHPQISNKHTYTSKVSKYLYSPIHQCELVEEDLIALLIDLKGFLIILVFVVFPQL